MPAITLEHPHNLFDTFDATDLVRFKRTIKQSTATNMDAINPDNDEKTSYGENPDAFVDLKITAYGPQSEVTAVCLFTIVTYAWPDRMDNIKQRLTAIGEAVVGYIPRDLVREGQDALNITFLGKDTGCWVAL